MCIGVQEVLRRLLHHQPVPGPGKDITWINVDAQFVLSWGAKVNNNKRRVGTVYTELWAGGITDRYREFASFDLPPFDN